MGVLDAEEEGRGRPEMLAVDHVADPPDREPEWEPKRDGIQVGDADPLSQDVDRDSDRRANHTAVKREALRAEPLARVEELTVLGEKEESAADQRSAHQDDRDRVERRRVEATIASVVPGDHPADQDPERDRRPVPGKRDWPEVDRRVNPNRYDRESPTHAPGRLVTD